MMRLKSNLAQLCLLATQQKLDQAKIEWDARSAMGIVLAANGYPDAYPLNLKNLSNCFEANICAIIGAWPINFF
jgi:phosphoribosylamine-glycine ligase